MRSSNPWKNRVTSELRIAKFNYFATLSQSTSNSPKRPWTCWILPSDVSVRVILNLFILLLGSLHHLMSLRICSIIIFQRYSVLYSLLILPILTLLNHVYSILFPLWLMKFWIFCNCWTLIRWWDLMGYLLVYWRYLLQR